MKQLASVHVGVPLKSLSRMKQTVRGSHAGSLWEVDTTHSISYENLLSKDPISIKQLHNVLSSGLYVCDHANLQVFGGPRILNYNETSSLTGEFASGTTDLLMARYHHKQSKYSISLMDLNTRQLRIAKLLDDAPTGLLYNEPGRSTSAAAIFECEQFVYLLDLQKGKMSNFEQSTLLSDGNYLYLTDRNETKAIDRRSHRKQFEFELKREPLRIETFNYDVMVGSSSGVEFYDFRKLTRMVGFAPINHLQDFLHDPNISRLFVSAAQELIVFEL